MSGEAQTIRFLVLDLSNGGIDGFYNLREDADLAADYWRERLGHENVIVAETNETGRIGDCFLSAKFNRSTTANRAPQ